MSVQEKRSHQVDYTDEGEILYPDYSNGVGWQMPEGLEDEERLDLKLLKPERAGIGFMARTKMLGEGGSAQVSCCLCGSKEVAKKTITINGADIRLNDINHEIDILTLVGDHNNIAKFYGFKFIRNKRDKKTGAELAFERCGKPLTGLLGTKGAVTLDVIMGVFVDLTNGLRHLHKKDIVHLDLKEDNVVLGEDGLFKIIDFGIAEKLSDLVNNEKAAEYFFKYVGTTRTIISSEMRQDSPRKTLSELKRQDVYSLGRMLQKLLMKVNKPVEDSEDAKKHAMFVKLQKALISKERPACAEGIEQLFEKIVEDIYSRDESEHP